MATPRWQFIISDLHGVPIGEPIAPSDEKVVLPLGRIPTASFTTPLHTAYAPQIMDADCLVRGYYTDHLGNKALRFHGPLIAPEENGDNLNQSIAVAAAGPFWRLGKRIIPGSDGITGLRMPASGEQDLGTLALDILDVVNGGVNVNGSLHPGYTGISRGSSSGAVGTGIAWYQDGQPVIASEALTELSSGINSFEFDIVPTEPTDVGQAWPQIGVMNVGPLVGGVSRSDAVFEYGTPRGNVTAYKRQVSRDGLMTRPVITPPSYPTDPAIYSTIDETAYGQHGLFEDVIDNLGIEDPTLRQKLADENLAVRKNPRQIITFSPAMNARPAPFVDYNLGDYVHARAVVDGSVRFDGFFRIWGITFTVDKNGNEAVELELQEP